MRHYIYVLILVMSQMVMGQMFDPPPLNPDPMLSGTPVTESAPVAMPTQPGEGGGVLPPMQRFKKPLVAREKTRVAVLGYHNFSETKPVTEMLLRTSELRSQMETIRNSPYSVISMQEFLEWRFGTRLLPEECILITLDDGWKSVYTDAYPIFKEYGYPFHLFLYTDYLHGKGESMNADMIREMMKNGASIGSHSHSHPYPSDWNKYRALGEEAYYEFIDKEIGESKVKLDKLFGSVNTYCYPGGFNDQEMLSRLPGYGYVAAFTVIPGKATSTEIPFQIHRYMVFGTDPSIFNNAMDFSVVESGSAISTGSQPGTLPKNTAKPPFAVTPLPDSTVGCTIPAITAQLSSVPGINMSTVRMRVSSFGTVRPTVNIAERTITWTPPCRIYMPNISVHLTWETTDGAKGHAEWSFSIDRSVTAE